MMHKSTALDVFDEIVKVMNDSGLWEANLTWYYTSAISWIRLNGLEHSLRIHGYSATWFCLIIKVLATQMNHMVTVLWLTALLPFVQQMLLVASLMLWLCLNS